MEGVDKGEKVEKEKEKEPRPVEDIIIESIEILTEK
jgi:hypothetical protein